MVHISSVKLFEGYLVAELLAIDEMIKCQSMAKGPANAMTHSPASSIDSIESDAAMSSSSGKSVAFIVGFLHLGEYNPLHLTSQ